jgi:hypothetical protein
VIIKWREQTDSGETVHEFDWAGAPRTKEMRWIKERTEFKTTIAFLNALEEMDPDAMAALICILNARHGRTLKFSDVDIDPLNEIDFVLNETEQARAGLIKLINEGGSTEGKAKADGDAPPVQTSGISNGALSAAVLKPSLATTPLASGDGTASTTAT